MAEELSKRILIIPSYHTLSKAAIKRITGWVNDGLVETSRAVSSGRRSDSGSERNSDEIARETQSANVSKPRGLRRRFVPRDF